MTQAEINAAERERTILRLETLLEARNETVLDLRARVRELEERLARLTSELVDALKSRPATMAGPVSGPQAGAGSLDTAISLGPKAQRAISAVAGRNRALGRELTLAAYEELAANPELEDAALAAKILDGESPDLASDDDDVETARGRVIPGGGVD